MSGARPTSTPEQSSASVGEMPPLVGGQTAERTSIPGVLFAFGAAAAYGVSQVLTRQGVEDTTPLVGTFIALFWGTMGFAALSTRALLTQRSDHLWRGVLYFGAGGLLSAMGVLLLFAALSRGQVIIVAPVAATNPLFTLLFVLLLLRGVERITWRIVFGALLVMCGVVILSVF